ncbi:MAG: TVP38/TMEM64 family protein [Defluviitaleaceae bacterium]|nr:TVP38/TMEM64 family protein [Defluviitaleaceae bacterium]
MDENEKLENTETNEAEQLETTPPPIPEEKPKRIIMATKEAPSEAESTPAKKRGGGIIKIIIAVVVIGVVFLIANALGLTERIQDFHAMRDWFQGLGWIGYAVYIVIFILVCIFMLPAAPFTIIAGITFGPWQGAILALVSATIGSAAAFLVARYIARDMIVNKFKDNRFFKKIDEGFEKNGVSFLILTRLVPVFPFNLQNYVYGLTGIKFWTFVIVSFITMAPGAFIYAFIAGQIVEEGFTWQLMVQFAVAGVLLFLVSLIPKYIAKKKGIKLDD